MKSEIQAELEKIKIGFNKDLVVNLKREIIVQYEIIEEKEIYWSIIITNKELNIIDGSIENPTLKFKFRGKIAFLNYLRGELKELRGWMNEYYTFDGSLFLLSFVNKLFNLR